VQASFFTFIFDTVKIILIIILMKISENQKNPN